MPPTKQSEFEALCRAHHAWEPAVDLIPFQRRARLLQALWREVDFARLDRPVDQAT